MALTKIPKSSWRSSLFLISVAGGNSAMKTQGNGYEQEEEGLHPTPQPMPTTHLIFFSTDFDELFPRNSRATINPVQSHEGHV
jgi:hypothetical protein